MADWLARKGAALHAPPEEEVRKRQHAKQLARAVQNMMVDIVEARAAAKPFQEEELQIETSDEESTEEEDDIRSEVIE
eukprot:5983894-Karenia_brevis.AAC.1